MMIPAGPSLAAPTSFLSGPPMMMGTSAPARCLEVELGWGEQKSLELWGHWDWKTQEDCGKATTLLPAHHAD